MKKFFALALALALTLAMAVTCFAANTIGAGEEAKTTVSAKYVSPTLSGEVYGVDVAFGAMQFTYTAESQGTWNPETHAYEEKVDAKWTANGNTVVVTNHSNVAITVNVAYANAQGVTGVVGTVTNGSFDLASAVGTAVNEAPTATATLNLSGAIAETNNAIGTVTVSFVKK